MCKFFLDAIENNKYGWFWVCPAGGGECMYRHALPPGFVLKRDKKKEEKDQEISMEELIESEVRCAAVGPFPARRCSFWAQPSPSGNRSHAARTPVDRYTISNS